MKYKLLFTIMATLLYAQYGRAQQALDSLTLAHIPMTKVQRSMLNITDPVALEAAYDSLKTSYDRRYFINALPGYFRLNNITTVPSWVSNAIIAAFSRKDTVVLTQEASKPSDQPKSFTLASKDPLLVNEAVQVAGTLKIQCATELMDLYKTVHTTFGCNENMIKSAILMSLIPMTDANKQQFYLDLLTNESFPVLSASFSALLEALNSQPSQAVLPKLAEYSARLDSLATKMAAQKPPDSRLELCRKMLAKVNNLRSSITNSTNGGGQ